LADRSTLESYFGSQMSVLMPAADEAVLARRLQIVADLQAIVPGEGVISAERAMRPYESDGLTAYKQLPMVVVLPETTEQVAAVLRYCHDNGVRVVPRGAGTSLSGGALPLVDGVLLGMGKFNRIREIDFGNRVAVVEPGVTNLAISTAVAAEAFYYAPDPSSQIACTIGGNVAENSGGVHCLKYGMTTNNILGLEMVLMTGDVVLKASDGLVAKTQNANYADGEGIVRAVEAMGLLRGMVGFLTFLLAFDLRGGGSDGPVPVGLALGHAAGVVDDEGLGRIEVFVEVRRPQDAEIELLVLHLVPAEILRGRSLGRTAQERAEQHERRCRAQGGSGHRVGPRSNRS